MRLQVLALVAAMALPSHASAQSVVGKAVVDGKTVTLFDDGTWKPADSQGSAGAPVCDDVTPTVQFCAQAVGWISTPPPTNEINAAYRIDARHYAQFLIEELGSDDGFTAEFMRQVVLDNAASVTGSAPEVIDVQPVTLGALSGDTVIYRIKFNGLNVVYANSILVEPKRVMQVMTYAIGNEYTPQHTGYHAAFLANTKLSQ